MPFQAENWTFLDDFVVPDEAGTIAPMPSIVGPIDVRYALRLRELLADHVTLYRTCLMDVFVLSLGESPRRESTKIGGLPYLHRREQWPLSPSGDPLPFLAQFDFRESFDLIEDIPGDLLLIFGNLDGEEGFHLLWQTAALPESDLFGEREVPETSGIIPKFWGTRWRVNNYAEYQLDQQFEDGNYELKDSLNVGMFEFALQLGGMTIGRCPFVLKDSEVTQDGEKILCTLEHM